MKFYEVFVILSQLLLLHQVASVDLDSLTQRLLENQLQNAAREQQSLANRLARNGIVQVENSAKQLQFAQMMQSVAANVMASKGLNDLKSIELLGVTTDIRQCYSLNKFSFGDALNTARSTAMQCINDKLDEGKAIVDNAINDIQTAAQDVGDSAKMIAQCSQFTITFLSIAGLVARVTCLSQAMLNMKSSAILLPINLSRRAVDANAAISTIQSDIMKCNLNILSAIVTQSTKAGKAIADCISQSSSVNNLGN